MIACFLLAIKMTLQFRINILRAENFYELLRGSLRLPGVSVKIFRQWAVTITSQANQTFGMTRQLIRRDRTLAGLCMLGHTQLHQGDQPAKILVAGAIPNQERKSLRSEIWSLRFEIWSLRFEIWSLRFEIWSLRFEI